MVHRAWSVNLICFLVIEWPELDYCTSPTIGGMNSASPSTSIRGRILGLIFPSLWFFNCLDHFLWLIRKCDWPFKFTFLSGFWIGHLALSCSPVLGFFLAYGIICMMWVFLGLVRWTCFGALATTEQWHCSWLVLRNLPSLQIPRTRKTTYHLRNVSSCLISK